MGSGAGAGKVNVQDLSLTKYIDTASPPLMLACCNGKHFPEAKLTVRKAGETPLEYLVIKMTEVMVTSVSTGGSGGEDRLTENVTLNFAKVEVTYTPQDAKGKVRAIRFRSAGTSPRTSRSRRSFALRAGPLVARYRSAVRPACHRLQGPPCHPEPSPRQVAEERFRAGDLAQAACRICRQAVRKDPADAKLRIFLAQLLMLQGDWDRAVNQLKVVGEVDAGALPMAHAYSTAIQCERLRADVFAGTRGPLLFGEPEPWIAQLMQSLTLLGQGNAQQAAELRAQAFDAAPATAGTLNGEPFEWIADADSRLGPMLEVLLNGAYYWVPLHRVTRVTVEAAERCARPGLAAGAVPVDQRR